MVVEQIVPMRIDDVLKVVVLLTLSLRELIVMFSVPASVVQLKNTVLSCRIVILKKYVRFSSDAPIKITHYSTPLRSFLGLRLSHVYGTYSG